MLQLAEAFFFLDFLCQYQYFSNAFFDLVFSRVWNVLKNKWWRHNKIYTETCRILKKCLKNSRNHNSTRFHVFFSATVSKRTCKNDLTQSLWKTREITTLRNFTNFFSATVSKNNEWTQSFWKTREIASSRNFVLKELHANQVTSFHANSHFSSFSLYVKDLQFYLEIEQTMT